MSHQRSESPLDDTTPSLPATAQAPGSVHPERDGNVNGSGSGSVGQKRELEGKDGGDVIMEPAAKRQRTMSTEEKKRGQRLFGNLLGTLNRFTKDERSKANTERVRNREAIATKVAEKLNAEQKRVHEINDLEKEIKLARNEIERLELGVKVADMTYRAKSKQFPLVSKFLLTSSPYLNNSATAGSSKDSAGDGAKALFLALGPPRDPLTASKPRPIYYLPKHLLPEQEDLLDLQRDKYRDLLDIEQDQLDALESDSKKKIDDLLERRRKAQVKLEEFREETRGREREEAVKKLGESLDLGDEPMVGSGEGEGEKVKVQGKEREREESRDAGYQMELDAPEGVTGGGEGDEVEY